MKQKAILIGFTLAVLLSLPVAIAYAYLSKPENPPLTVELYAKGSFDQQNVFVRDPLAKTTLYIVTWTAPKQMHTNQHVIVKADVYPAPEVANKIAGNNVHVIAELLGDGFTIKNSNPSDPKGRGKLSLHWEVIPKQEGEFPLEFKLVDRSRNENSENEHSRMTIKDLPYHPDLHQKDSPSFCTINVVTPFHFIEDGGKIAGLVSTICQWPFWAFVFLRKHATPHDKAKSAKAST